MAEYATAEELKQRLGGKTVEYNGQLDDAVSTASRWIDTYCERTFGKDETDATRKFKADSPACLELPSFADIVSVTTLATDADGDGDFETVWDAADYELDADEAHGPEPRPYTRIRAIGARSFPVIYGPRARRYRVQITGIFGWPAVPDPVRQACLIMASELFRLKDAPLGIAEYSEMGLARARSNPQALILLGPYRRYSHLVA